VDILTTLRGSSTDLHFAPLLREPVFAALTPAMPALLAFLRGRLAGQDPTLRLDPRHPKLALTLLLAGQALLAAADQMPATPGAGEQRRGCLRRLADRPTGRWASRTTPGDLAVGLTEQQRQRADEEAFLRDEARRFLTGAVPVRAVLVAPGDRGIVVLDVTARPELEEVLRLLHLGGARGAARTPSPPGTPWAPANSPGCAWRSSGCGRSTAPWRWSRTPATPGSCCGWSPPAGTSR